MKKRFRSYAECEHAWGLVQTKEILAHKMLAAMLNKDVTWFKRGAYKAGVGPMSPATLDCPLVLVYKYKGQNDTIQVYDANDWAATTIRNLVAMGSKDKEQFDLMALAALVRDELGRKMMHDAL